MLRKIILLLIVLLFIGCDRDNNKRSFSFIALNTTCFITVYNSPDADLNRVESIVKSIDKKMSRYNNTSDIYKINRLAGSGYYNPDKEVLEVLKMGLKYSYLSDGYFDITIGPLVDLWNINNMSKVPNKALVEEARKLVNYENIVIDNSGVMLKKMGMSIDLGAIAKGYASDRVKDYLIKAGVKSALINLGGNVSVIGDKPDGSKWNIGIQHPREVRGEYIGVLPLRDLSFISSGDYERYFFQDGKRYHHIFNSKTGYPKNGEIISSSIVTKSAINGDALSTVTFGMSIKEVKKLREKIEFQGVFITKDKRIYITPGLKSIFTLKDNRYRLIYD